MEKKNENEKQTGLFNERPLNPSELAPQSCSKESQRIALAGTLSCTWPHRGRVTFTCLGQVRAGPGHRLGECVRNGGGLGQMGGQYQMRGKMGAEDCTTKAPPM